MARILITGGSRGIGAAMVRTLAHEGHDVCFFYKSSIDQAQSMTKVLRAEGCSVMAIQCDVSNSYTVQCAVNTLLEKWQEIDVLICCAGVSYTGLLQEILDAEWQDVFSTNVHGAFYCTKAVLPHMISKRSGNIIYLSSIWGARGAANEVAYSASKGAIDSMTKALAQEVAYSGIRVNAIAPGPIYTDMMRSLGEATNASVLSEIPVGRLGTPEEVAKLASYLISPDADYITGQIITIAGGFVI